MGTHHFRTSTSKLQGFTRKGVNYRLSIFIKKRPYRKNRTGRIVRKIPHRKEHTEKTIQKRSYRKDHTEKIVKKRPYRKDNTEKTLQKNHTEKTEQYKMKNGFLLIINGGRGLK